MASTSLKSTLKKIHQKLKSFLKRDQPEATVKSFGDHQRKEAAFDSRVRGIRTVPLARIVGSVGRYQDFDNRFQLKDHLPSGRLDTIKELMRQGHALPPVRLYQIKDEYYVEDGNHRIAAAKELGHDEILAHILEFIPSGNRLEDFIYRQRSDFLDRTQLPAEINLTEPGQYERLLDQIAKHQAYLQETSAGPVSFEDAARDWYRYVYRPLCNIIRRGRLLESFPGRTIGDLYTYVSVHLWETGEKRHYGIGIHKLIPGNMEDFRNQMTNIGDPCYPEMQRRITAFVLMSVQAKREYKIVEKLFELEAVQEVHVVHGDVDLLVKVNLTRDLLSSDAEIISQFVHNKIRQLPGVISTKTLIPGFSRIKT
ncbi:MAG TPA: transcriptional regulator [Syntrophobacteraceae bacterium]|nr:transcriptional regulator [Syntrophobacteraceae bacterium]